MLSYRYMHMGMGQNYDGDSKISDASVVSPTGYGYMVTPTSMDVNMHMFGVMYAPTDKMTLMGMIPYVTKSMDHLTRAGGTFTTESKGAGDLKLSVLYTLLERSNHKMHGTFGFSSPTGQINAEDFIPPLNRTNRLPYPMQIGSGTFDLLFGLTYAGQVEAWSWGAQGTGTVRTGTNKNDYRLGDRYDLTAWGVRDVTDWMSASFRLNWQQSFNIVGADPMVDFMKGANPTADPSLRAIRRLDALFGVNFVPSKLVGSVKSLKGFRIALEGGLPAYQNLDGPQLGAGWMLTTGIQYSF
jgi:hypothetical protein